MTIIMRVAAAALALPCLSAGAASAAERENFTVRVSQAGLNLHTDAGRRAFDARVRRVAHWACTGRSSLDAWRETQRCTDELRADATRQVASRFGGGARLASIAD